MVSSSPSSRCAALLHRRRRGLIARAFAVLCVPVALAAFVPWQTQWRGLSDLVTRCHGAADTSSSTVRCGADVFFDAIAGLSAPPDNPAGAEVARNAMHTLHLVATLWYCVAIAAGSGAGGPRALAAWAALLGVLLLQPALHTESIARARPEPPFYDRSLRAMFPGAYADVPGLAFIVDAPTATGAFLAASILSAHTSPAAFLIGTAYGLLTILYAVSLRALSTPALALTLLTAWSIARGVPVAKSVATDDAGGDAAASGATGASEDDGKRDRDADARLLGGGGPIWEIGDDGIDASDAGDADDGDAKNSDDVLELRADEPFRALEEVTTDTPV